MSGPGYQGVSTKNFSSFGPDVWPAMETYIRMLILYRLDILDTR